MAAVHRTGFQLSEAVLGSGMLLIPPIILGFAGSAAPAAWMAHLTGGAALSLLVGLVAYERKGAGSIADLGGAILGRWAYYSISIAYLVGFTVGQAAIALAGGGFVAGSIGSSQRAAYGAALLLAATAAAVAGVELGRRARRLRLGLTATLAMLAALRPEVLVSSGLLQPVRRRELGAAMLLLLFAGVGWESSGRRSADLTSRNQVITSVAIGAALVAVALLLPVLTLQKRAGAIANDDVLTRTVAAAAALVLWSYCVAGLAAAAAMITELGGSNRRWVRAAVGAASTAALLITLALGTGVVGLLLVPCLAAWVAYTLLTWAMARTGSPRRRTASAGLFISVSMLLPWAATAAV